ncbi:response regulator transcription factor [Amycolatopsis sp.]|jgi:DNA-binding NarL/FixJ family response regulator|uniref:response regulator transcription factor n=1 Tax=Amycolatopsis sp. TaxID=37632 RepID=UPI002DF7B9BE|nr:response regulator transcription factor [Amycolatopsis sp.]
MTDSAISGTIRVFLVDDHQVVLRGLAALLQTQPDIALAGEAESGAAAVRELALLAARNSLPDIVLMDLMMPGLDGLSAIAAIRERFPRVRLVALTSFAEAERVHAALEAGASGYLLKNADAREIIAAVRAAYRGELHITPSVAGVLARSMGWRSPSVDLTSREREVVVLVAQGRSNQEIARKLVISERTARTHVSHVIGKLGVGSRVQAALWAIREGLVTEPTKF